MGELHVLLQTDIVDSTRIAEQLGDEAWAALSEAHDIAARDLLPKWRGREIDKSDGFLLLFTSVVDAVGYAFDYHLAATALAIPLSARAGIHVGPLIARENVAAHVARGAKVLEVDGVAKPLTARVMAIAGGRQTLLTAAARHALGPTDWRVQSHGHWRMKGLAEPLELFEVGGPHAPFVPPADSTKGHRVVQRGELWVPTQELRHSLPAERDSFVGRGGALVDLARHFDVGARLVTIVGMGGAGKTRLAQRFGWRWLGDYPGGVWFCDLTQAKSLEGIVFGVGLGLDVPLGDAPDPVARLADAISGRGRCLLVLDNLEQVAQHAEASVGRWLDRASEASFLVTSREALRIPGEAVLMLAPLVSEEGASLFIQRAEAAKAGLVLRGEDRSAIEPLVALLDGLPLAIELAAARVAVMPPRLLLARMSERFRWLTSNGRRGDRQATLRSTLDWSWDLLSEVEKSALVQLSVFEGGFDLQAAEAVLDLRCAGDPDSWVPDAIQSLADKSLVRAIDGSRFDLLISVQAYAAEKLAVRVSMGDGSEGEAPLRHWTWFAEMAAAEVAARGGLDLDNVVAACRRAAYAAQPKPAVRALRNAWAGLRLRGPHGVALQLASSMQRLEGLDDVQAAVVRWVAGSAAHAMGQDGDARAHFDAGLEYVEKTLAAGVHAQLLCARAQLALASGRPDEARIDLDLALDLSIRSTEVGIRCDVLNVMGTTAIFGGDAALARKHYEDALKLARRDRNQHAEGGLLGNIGNLSFEEGDFAKAASYHHSALDLALSSGDRRWEGNARCNLGLVYHEMGDAEKAEGQFELSRVIARQLGYRRLEATLACNLGIVLEAKGECDGALANYNDAVTIARELEDHRSTGQFLGFLGRALARVERFAEAANAFDEGERALVETHDASETALLLLRRAEAHCMAMNPVAGIACRDRALQHVEGREQKRNKEMLSALASVAAALVGVPSQTQGRL